jgi:hypothetical protein
MREERKRRRRPRRRSGYSPRAQGSGDPGLNPISNWGQHIGVPNLFGFLEITRQDQGFGSLFGFVLGLLRSLESVVEDRLEREVETREACVQSCCTVY